MIIVVVVRAIRIRIVVRVRLVDETEVFKHGMR